MQSMRTRAAIRAAVVTALAATLVAPAAHAQAPAGGPALAWRPAFELRPIVGGYVPTGELRDVLEGGVLAGAQASWHFHPLFAATANFGWGSAKDRTTGSLSRSSGLFTGRTEDVDVFNYDAGLEARGTGLVRGRSWMLSPFVGLGLGGRTYRYRDVDAVDAQTTFAGYGSVGADLAPFAGRFGLRLEARNYISRYEGLRGEWSDATSRNDLAIGTSVTIRF